MTGLIVDLFAGGGGEATGIARAFGRSPDIAVNHSPAAILMHETNHPGSMHYIENVWDVNPRDVCRGRHVALLWLSPDCTHHSKARGGKPKDKHKRGLAWSAVWWAAAVRPDVIILENVEEFQSWGPLGPDGQPDLDQQGRTFQNFVRALRAQGYEVDWRELVACDYGAPTSRRRFYLVARCDGRPIAWPKPTHGDPDSIEVRCGLLKPWRMAAEIINWSLPCPSIFDTSEEIMRKYGLRAQRPLKENTMSRIARGFQRFVLEDPEPFIVNCKFDNKAENIERPLSTITTVNSHCIVTPVMTAIGQTSCKDRSYGVDEPVRTIVSKQEQCLIAPTLIQYHSAGPDGRERGQAVDAPLRTVDCSNRYALTCAFLSKYFGGGYTGPGADIAGPLPTVTCDDHNALVTSHLVKLYGTSYGSSVRAPLPTVTAQSNHIGEVRAFLVKYYGKSFGQSLNTPLDTVTCHERYGLVVIHGTLYQIVDIGMRMLTPRELFDAQGFPHSYIIDHDFKGQQYPKYAQVERAGDAVCPDVAAALAEANLPELRVAA